MRSCLRRTRPRSRTGLRAAAGRVARRCPTRRLPRRHGGAGLGRRPPGRPRRSTRRRGPRRASSSSTTAPSLRRRAGARRPRAAARRAYDLTVVLGAEGPLAERLRADGVVVEVLPVPGTGAGAAATPRAGWRPSCRARRRTPSAWPGCSATGGPTWCTPTRLRSILLTAPAAGLAGVPLVVSARDLLDPPSCSRRRRRRWSGTAAGRAAAGRRQQRDHAGRRWRPGHGRTTVVPSPGTVRGPVVP